jgi:hypothetical protein
MGFRKDRASKGKFLRIIKAIKIQQRAISQLELEIIFGTGRRFSLWAKRRKKSTIETIMAKVIKKFNRNACKKWPLKKA